MGNLIKLFKGEIFRLYKYRIIFFSLIISIIWVIFIALISKEEAIGFIPFLIIMDDALMSIVFLATSFFYEKQESIPKSLLVAPISVSQILASKVFASIFTGTISLIVIFLTSFLVHGIVFNLLLAFLFMLLAVFGHTAIGYLIILASKDFMGFMVKFMFVIIALLLPTLFVALQIIPSNLEFLAIISPTYASQLLVNSLFINVDWWKVLLSSIYLFALGALLFSLIVVKKYQRYSLES